MEGIALDNDVALAFIDGEYKIIKNEDKSNAYQVSFNKNEFIIKVLNV